ncbi:MAG TPA: FAD-dependent oxidoreductase [Syntrophorhabdaceae bacterium]|nr:FAD-dependent oxidoreductase [Syntrophorhabdaceae bacterium]
MGRYPVIIIGAGIGGLATAAALSKKGIASLLLEKNAFPGGRCSTRSINGNPHEIGAIYVGGGVFDHLRNDFGLNLPSAQIKCGIRIGRGMVSFPFGFKTVLQLRACGVPITELLRMKYKARALSDPGWFRVHPSVGHIIDSLTGNSILRKVLHTASGLSGTSPYRLPGTYLDENGRVIHYRALNPEYLPSGNAGIAHELLRLARTHCEVLLNTKVSHIEIHDGIARSVETDKGRYEGRIVVSNTGLKETVLRLTDSSAWPAPYYEEVRNLGDALQVVNVFLTFSRSFALPRGHAVFLMPYEVHEEFRLLETGSFPLDSMFVLHVPSNINAGDGATHHATLQFYHPRQMASQDSVKRQAERVVRLGLNNLFDGLSQAVIDYIVYDPRRYEEEFGFVPSVFGVSPDLKYRRFPVKAPVSNLFFAGDSVEPDGPCVAQAFESGLECADRICREISSTGE